MVVGLQFKKISVCKRCNELIGTPRKLGFFLLRHIYGVTGFPSSYCKETGGIAESDKVVNVLMRTRKVV